MTRNVQHLGNLPCCSYHADYRCTTQPVIVKVDVRKVT